MAGVSDLNDTQISEGREEVINEKDLKKHNTEKDEAIVVDKPIKKFKPTKKKLPEKKKRRKKKKKTFWDKFFGK